MKYGEKKGQRQLKQGSNDVPADTLDKIWEMTAAYKASYQPDTDGAWANLSARLQDKPLTKVVSFQRRMLQLAAALLLLVIGVWGIKRCFDAQPELKVVSTSLGQTTSVTLPDGTKVTLNENSELAYPAAFDAPQRKVSMKGEAFFEVTPNQAKPFLAETPSGTVQVLGTAFNVRSMDTDGDLEVVVRSGKVAVQPVGKDEKLLLQKGDRLVFNSQKGILTTNRDESGAAWAWQTGGISYKNENLREILNGMERFFHVTITNNLHGPSGCPQTLAIEKNKLNEAFAVLEALCPSIKIKLLAPGQYEISGSCCD